MKQDILKKMLRKDTSIKMNNLLFDTSSRLFLNRKARFLEQSDLDLYNVVSFEKENLFNRIDNYAFNKKIEYIVEDIQKSQKITFNMIHCDVGEFFLPTSIGSFLNRTITDDFYGNVDEDGDSKNPNAYSPKQMKKPFLLGETEITVELYQAIIGLDADNNDLKFPALSVSWYNAILFCNRLSEILNFEKCYRIPYKKMKDENEDDDYYGMSDDSLLDMDDDFDDLDDLGDLDSFLEQEEEREQILWDDQHDIDIGEYEPIYEKIECNLNANGFRLPTLDEWEYAAMMGKVESPYKTFEDYANYSKYDFDQIPKDVGSKQPNQWGFYDMLGNVSEWCNDKFKNFYKNSSKDYILALGGSFKNKYYGDDCEIGSANGADNDIGFRIARSVI